MKKMQDNKMFENLPACVAEYIKRVIKKMKWRKSVRADVQAELIGHFEDALKDCKNEDEKEKRAKELIQNFGDAKLIADLARRAKKRCRPIWVKTIIRAFQAVCIAIGLFVIYVLWFISGKPAITTNYIEVANNMVRQTDDDSQNAFSLYEEASKLIKIQGKFEAIGKDFSEANEIDIAQIRQWLDKNTEALNLVARGTEKPYYWRTYCGQEPNGTDIYFMEMPYYSEYRILAYGLRWRAYLYARDGQYDKAFTDLLTMYKFGNHLCSKGILFDQFFGMPLRALSGNDCIEILSKHNIPAEYLKTFLNNLQPIVSNGNFSLAESIDFQKLCIYDEIQRCYTKEFFGINHIYIQRLIYRRNKWLSQLNVECDTDRSTAARGFICAIFSRGNSQQARLAVEEYYDFWKNVAVEPPYLFKDCNLDAEAEKIIKGYRSLSWLVSSWDTFIKMSWRNKAEVESSLAIIALHVYKQEKGHWPENLQELVSAGLLTSLPMDPYSDKPLVYKKIDSEFILYGFGSDFDDDGGKIGTNTNGTPQIWNTEDGDAVFWPVKVK